MNAAQKLSVEAGQIILKHYSQDISVTLKKQNEPVTEADKESNLYITEKLQKLFPEDGILAEESKDNRERRNKSRVWIVDPMDGTKEFIDKNGQFAVMIGLAQDGLPVMGVVYQPVTKKMFYATKGGGAFLKQNDEVNKLIVSKVNEASQMRLVVSRSHRSKLLDEIKNELRIEKDIATGSVGLKVGLLVENKSDLYIHPNSKTKEWDTCAPQIILEEAGGRMTDCWGSPMLYNKENVFNDKGYVASNNQCHPEIVERIEPFLAQMD